MKRRLIMIFVPIAIVGLAVIWWLVSPLFINKTVNEELPFELPSIQETNDMTAEDIAKVVDDAMSQLTNDVMESLSENSKAELEANLMQLAAKMPNLEVSENMPKENSLEILAQGNFQDADGFHKGSGKAKILRQGEQSILRFEDFQVTNGPDLHVLLVENLLGKRHEELGNYLDLGSLKGNIGNQNYQIPSDTDLSFYNGVMIYCMPFHVVFSTAELQN